MRPTTPQRLMPDDALIHLRVRADLKARWVCESRAAGMRLTDWIVSRVEAGAMRPTTIIIAGIPFAALRLGRDLQGSISFDVAVIERIEHASGLPAGYFLGQDEGAVAELISRWYASHRAAGGEPDPVAEDLLAEVAAEDAAGQPYSHAPGQA